MDVTLHHQHDDTADEVKRLIAERDRWRRALICLAEAVEAEAERLADSGPMQVTRLRLYQAVARAANEAQT